MTEAKGSDVRALRDDLSKLFDALCFLDSGYQHQRGMASDETTRLLNAIMPLVEARVQAAVVEMRERCAAQAAQCAVEFSRSVLSLEGVKSTIRSLPIPADALDAMLLRARIEEHIELHAKGACGTGECLRLKNQRAELAALTQPAPEVNGAKD